MWHKTFAGLLSGLIVMVLVPSSISLLLPNYIGVVLALGLIFALSTWAGVMTWCYAADSSKQAWLRAAKVSVPSIIIFIGIFFTAAGPTG
ncbi:hypothetical protein [Pseudoalteromonas aurantia]|jgi:hypothetical protein|uniref:Uncharacterized protein n=1 Tax=Pseudoalteromonas aurantia TaxID=43654 RepID=A0A5S3V9S8_9GAMM|nr:hypothetical protein [Pseudoalteromonas aurantia]TMO59413.1 hypothetical protein CWC18_15915 [Pseudoalteromonas aurantia]TMO68580.1 hypothetical protein CWC19_08875 [Pseudoalteromonas aurantia]TMO72790.1 hypothetical protein CWC20_14560 [Pseudoalteromonas aurantia]